MAACKFYVFAEFCKEKCFTCLLKSKKRYHITIYYTRTHPLSQYFIIYIRPVICAKSEHTLVKYSLFYVKIASHAGHNFYSSKSVCLYYATTVVVSAFLGQICKKQNRERSIEKRTNRHARFVRHNY